MDTTNFNPDGTIDFLMNVGTGVRFTPTAAGHVLGAAMFSIEIDGIRVLYTGDYSMEEDRHLMCAEIPSGGPPDVLIVESTFGVVTLPAREERESRFTGTGQNDDVFVFVFVFLIVLKFFYSF